MYSLMDKIICEHCKKNITYTAIYNLINENWSKQTGRLVYTVACPECLRTFSKELRHFNFRHYNPYLSSRTKTITNKKEYIRCVTKYNDKEMKDWLFDVLENQFAILYCDEGTHNYALGDIFKPIEDYCSYVLKHFGTKRARSKIKRINLLLFRGYYRTQPAIGYLINSKLMSFLEALSYSEGWDDSYFFKKILKRCGCPV